MCRLLAYASREATTFPQVIGPHFDEYVQLSTIHCDGWGISDSQGDLVRDTTSARDSEQLAAAIQATSSTAALFHLRWASPGIPVDIANNHPFAFGKYSFIHNGSLKPYDALDTILKAQYAAEIKSASDSHRYFMLLMQNIDQLGLEGGTIKSIADIRSVATYASLNAMLLSPDYLVMINEHDVNNRPAIVGEDYYEIRYKLTEDSIAIGSSGWNQDGWVLLPNHTIMIVNRKDLTVNFLDLP